MQKLFLQRIVTKDWFTFSQSVYFWSSLHELQWYSIIMLSCSSKLKRRENLSRSLSLSPPHTFRVKRKLQSLEQKIFKKSVHDLQVHLCFPILFVFHLMYWILLFIRWSNFRNLQVTYTQTSVCVCRERERKNLLAHSNSNSFSLDEYAHTQNHTHTHNNAASIYNISSTRKTTYTCIQRILHKLAQRRKVGGREQISLYTQEC